jgi:hypothetical protein
VDVFERVTHLKPGEDRDVVLVRRSSKDNSGSCHLITLQHVPVR